MIAVDTNILVYAHRQEAEWHREAEQAVRRLAEGRDTWAIPWPCLHEFLAIVTHPRIFRTPTPMSHAIAQIVAWTESPTLVALAENEAYWPMLRALLERARVVGPRIHDARVAALCISHAVTELWTADRDFARFSGVRTRNPLVGR